MNVNSLISSDFQSFLMCSGALKLSALYHLEFYVKVLYFECPVLKVLI